jgi:hypothetical protein
MITATAVTCPAFITRQKNLGVDESVMWGDYFFVEALTKVVHPQE